MDFNKEDLQQNPHFDDETGHETATRHDLDTFERLESRVRSYIRSYPALFATAEGSWLTDVHGKRYLDFLSGAGSLNYGHNPPALKQVLMEYLANNGMVHGLDMATAAKARFIETFEKRILKPRRMHYRLQFTGPTGTNAVEAALKIARQVTGRTPVISFTNAFHGVTAGSVAATGNDKFRRATGMPLSNTIFMPYCGYFGQKVDTLGQIEKLLDDNSSGVDKPAAVLVETVQGEGGVNTASVAWLQGLEKLCREREILLIVDDIQVGCGRTGTFFSFEEAGIRPDIITLSKSISGYGLPMSLVLMKPEHDIWETSAHNGTFRGNNLAFVTATAALERFWTRKDFQKSVQAKGLLLESRLRTLHEYFPTLVTGLRGRGMIAGLVMNNGENADAVSRLCFEENLIIETCGPDGEVLKLLPPLTATEDELLEGIDIISRALARLKDGVMRHDR